MDPSEGKSANARTCAGNARVGSHPLRQGDLTHAEKIIAASELNAVLPEADYVVLCAPETSETKVLIGAEELARLKRGARLINVGRGTMLDETALIRALESGTMAGAASDVTETEPLASEQPAVARAKSIYYPAHQRGKRQVVAARNGAADGIAGAMVRWPRTDQSRGLLARVLAAPSTRR